MAVSARAAGIVCPANVDLSACSGLDLAHVQAQIAGTSGDALRNGLQREGRWHGLLAAQGRPRPPRRAVPEDDRGVQAESRPQREPRRSHPSPDRRRKPRRRSPKRPSTPEPLGVVSSASVDFVCTTT